MSEENRQRGRTRRLNAAVVAAAVVAAAVLVNVLFADVLWRVDLTADRLYTLGPVSQQTAEQLEEPVDVRVFVSADLPPPYHRLEQRVEELLSEYEAASGGRLDYEVIDPDGDDDAEELARGYGIEPTVVGHETETERSVREVYKGVAFVQGPNQQTVPDLRASSDGEVADFEYEFTRALMRLAEPEPRRVGIVTGLGGPADRPGFVDRMRQLFSDRYGELIELEAVDLAGGDEIDDELSALIAVNVAGDVGSEGLARLHRFVGQGGSVGWFQSGAVVDERHLHQQLEYHRRAGLDQPPVPRRIGVESDLIDYFQSQGIRFGADAVVDRQRATSRGGVPTRHGVVEVDHPGVFSITDIDRQLPFTRHFSTLAVPMPATITVEHGALAGEADVYELLRTDKSAMRLEEPPEFAMYGDLSQPSSDEQEGPHTVAVALQGDLGADLEEAGETTSRMLVVGSGELISQAPEMGYTGELAALGDEFFVGGVEWLAQYDELADIRGTSMPPLVTDVPDDARHSIQFVNIVVVPALFASLGIAMLIRRRRRKEGLVDEFRADEADG